MEVAATKAKREQWLSKGCKAKETEERALKKSQEKDDSHIKLSPLYHRKNTETIHQILAITIMQNLRFNFLLISVAIKDGIHRFVIYEL